MIKMIIAAAVMIARRSHFFEAEFTGSTFPITSGICLYITQLVQKGSPYNGGLFV
jgi:hypothetical protein